MKKIIKIITLFFVTVSFAQTGHLMQGIGSVNMSMGGAATAQPIDISGAMQWNPATISSFDAKIMNIDFGLFFAKPKLSSSVPAGLFGPGTPEVSGLTIDKKKASPLPAFGMIWGKEESKHTFGISFFGVSGFGTDFPEETNLPMDAMGNSNANWNPNDSNVINYPQSMGGFGHVKSNYMLMQIGVTWAYEFSDKFSIGLQPTMDYSTLELAPNPLASPSQALGYPESDKATAIGFGGQIGLFFDSKKGFKAGVSYKSPQAISEFDFENTYLDGSEAENVNFRMDFPSILSFGLGYSVGPFDWALDYRMVNYKDTDGFKENGWTETGSVKGFGWEDMNIVSLGVQYKGVNKLPIRLGYTYSSNPIKDELAFFSIPATAVIENAFQIGLGYEFNDRATLNLMYHHGMSNGKTEGEMLNPMAVTPSNPYGAIAGTKVGYSMYTDLVMVGFAYNFSKKNKKE